MKIRLAVLLRVVGSILGAGVALVAVLAFFVWVSFDAERTAVSLSQHFKDRYQRTLVLAAEPQLRIWPRPALVLKSISVSEAGRNELFANAKSLQFDLAPVPLLLGRYRFVAVKVVGLDARVSRARSGDWNLVKLLLPASADAPAVPWQFDVAKIALSDARVRIDDARSGSKFEWRDVFFSLTGLQDNEPARLDVRGQWLDSTQESDFTFKLGARYGVAENLGSGRLENLRLQLDGKYSGLQGGKAQIDGARLDWVDWGSRGEIVKFGSTLQGNAGPQALKGMLGLSQLAWQNWRVQGKDLQSQLSLRSAGEQTDFEWELPQFGETESGFRGDAFSLGWQFKAGPDRTSQGNFKAKLEADVRNGALLLRSLRGDLSVLHPRLRKPSTKMNVSGWFHWRANQGSEVALDARSGQDKLQLQAQLEQLWPLQGKFDLRSPRLNLDQLMAEAKPGVKQAPLTMPSFENLTLNGNIKLADLRLGGVHFSSLQGPLSVEKGVLAAPTLSAGLYGGRLNANLLAEASNGQLGLQGDFSEVGLELLAYETRLPVQLTGRLTGTYKVVTTLNADKPPLAQLSGAMRWTLNNGAIRGVDIARSLREFRPSILAGTQLARSHNEDEFTELGTVSSRFVFAEGKLQADSIQSRNTWLSLRGAGGADMLGDQLDFSLQASLLPGIASMAAKDLADLRSKPIGLQLKGPLLRPDILFVPGTPAEAATKPAIKSAAPNKK